MLHEKLIRVPPWVTPDNHQRFAVKLAALYNSEEGSIARLSEDIGGSQSMLHMALKSEGGLNTRHCILLETRLGRDLFPREFFAPSLFPVERA